jgi:hypothetical protein
MCGTGREWPWQVRGTTLVPSGIVRVAKKGWGLNMKNLRADMCSGCKSPVVKFWER